MTSFLQRKAQLAAKLSYHRAGRQTNMELSVYMGWTCPVFTRILHQYVTSAILALKPFTQSTEGADSMSLIGPISTDIILRNGKRVGKRCNDISNYDTFGGNVLDSKAHSVDPKKKKGKGVPF